MDEYLNILQYYPFLVKGLLYTVLLSAVGMIFGTIIGILAALALLGNSRPLKWLATLYLDIFRSTPVLVQFIWVYYALPLVSGVSLDPLTASFIVLSLYSGAFHTETFRAGILSLERGQREGALAIGMSEGQAMRRVILPQAIVRMLPSYAGTLITLIKDSSLASTISVSELLRQGAAIGSYTMSPLPSLLVVGAIYFILTYAVARLGDAIYDRYQAL